MSHCSGISGGLVERWHVHHLLLFSHSVMPDSLWPHGLQHARLPCPSPSPGAWSNSCPLSQWYHPTISSSVIHFSSCLQSFPASRSFLMSQLFISGGQSIEASASASVLPMNIQDWFPLDLKVRKASVSFFKISFSLPFLLSTLPPSPRLLTLYTCKYTLFIQWVKTRQISE